MSLSNTLRTWRIHKGMNQRDAAKALGIDFTYISKIENGHLEPSVSLIERMALLYGRPSTDSDHACIERGELPSWVKAIILSNPDIMYNISDKSAQT